MRPEFTSADYDDVQADASAGRNVTLDALVAELDAFWALNQNARQAAWDRQPKAASYLEDALIIAEKATIDAADFAIAPKIRLTLKRRRRKSPTLLKGPLFQTTYELASASTQLTSSRCSNMSNSSNSRQKTAPMQL